MAQIRLCVSILGCLTLAGGCGGTNSGSCTLPDCVEACGSGIDSPAYEGATHVADGTSVTYVANPPASGTHSAVWQTPWGVYDTPVPRERWVHNLEHGAIVLSYNCPTGCADIVAQLVAIRDSRKPDQYNEVRILVTPDPLLPVKVAALAWRYRWLGNTVDATTISCFIDARYDRGPESVP